jgi:hypothetical protein
MPGMDAGVDHADFDAGAIGAGGHRLRRLHLGDAVWRGLPERIARCILFDVFDVGIVAQPLQRLRRHGDGNGAQIVEAVMHLATGGAQRILDLRTGAGLELHPYAVGIGLRGECSAGREQDKRGAQGRSEFLLLHDGDPLKGERTEKHATPGRGPWTMRRRCKPLCEVLTPYACNYGNVSWRCDRPKSALPSPKVAGRFIEGPQEGAKGYT